MPAIHWTNGWVGPSRGSGHWEQNNSTSAGNQTKTPRSPVRTISRLSFHTTQAPAPTQPSIDSAQPKQSLPPNFIFKNVWPKVITSQFRSHVFLCGSSEQDVEYCSDPLQPLHIWQTSLLCPPPHHHHKLAIMSIEEPGTDSWLSLPQWTGHVMQHQFGNHTVQKTQFVPYRKHQASP